MNIHFISEKAREVVDKLEARFYDTDVDDAGKIAILQTAIGAYRAKIERESMLAITKLAIDNIVR